QRIRRDRHAHRMFREFLEQGTVADGTPDDSAVDVIDYENLLSLQPAHRTDHNKFRKANGHTLLGKLPRESYLGGRRPLSGWRSKMAALEFIQKAAQCGIIDTLMPRAGCQ